MPAFWQPYRRRNLPLMQSPLSLPLAVMAAVVMVCVVAGHSRMARAQTDGCGPVQTPATTLEFIKMDPMLDRHRSVRWLNSRAGGSARYLVTGLTEYEMRASFNMRLMPRDVGFGRYCLTPITVNPRVEVIKHLVYVASELERGSCEYNVVYAHEGEHVKINQGMEADIQASLDDMVGDITRKLAAMPPMSGENVARSIKRLLAEYGRDFKRRLKDIDRNRREDHKRIDTPEEYTKLSLACGPNSAFQTVLPQAAR